MNIVNLLEMSASSFPDRIALGSRVDGMTYGELLERSGRAAAVLREADAEQVVFVGENGPAFPLALFASAWAGIPFVPMNFRLAADQLEALIDQHPGAVVIGDYPALAERFTYSSAQWTDLSATERAQPQRWTDEASDVAVVLYTSGTTSAPKAALLRHQHLTSYLLTSVEFGSAEPTAAALVSVPPYHIAGVSNLLSNVFAGRRLCYLDTFTPQRWLDCIRAEGITHAMVVPTMLARITESLRDAQDWTPPGLRSLAYGGSKMPLPVLERAVRLFRDTDFVNAYGLTETSSTIAVLGPQDHRAALDGDPVGRRRLGSVGKVLPSIEIQVRERDVVLGADDIGDVYVRGPQVSGEYRTQGSLLDADGWFATRDRGWVDADGYLFIEGRSDDTIIRGGENVAPAEIEDVLLDHPAVCEAVVVGIPDEQWGQDIAAAVVLRGDTGCSEDELRDWVRARLRSSKTPSIIRFVDELPQTATGKIIRRHVLEQFDPVVSESRRYS